jgi:ketol-acid reductoisomerase
MRWPAAQVTGIDLSMTSVRTTEALRRRYGLDNLTVHHLPIEQVGEQLRAMMPWIKANKLVDRSRN